jgi:hypothetical protein
VDKVGRKKYKKILEVGPTNRGWIEIAAAQCCFESENF